mmetsp:Transcript_19338/g.29643  ORF Transcript_19338/g.29643 Transcript_19338/m.29643 type:complete len:125 (-) Transcript_19338:31-405(-)
MSTEYFAGASRGLQVFSSSKDALNPKLNADVLRGRLETIEYYKFRYGKAHRFWLHTYINRVASQLWKYKFNYAVKGFLAFLVYQKYTNYQYMSSVSLLGPVQKLNLQIPIFVHAGIFAGACFVI